MKFDTVEETHEGITRDLLLPLNKPITVDVVDVTEALLFIEFVAAPDMDVLVSKRFEVDKEVASFVEFSKPALATACWAIDLSEDMDVNWFTGAEVVPKPCPGPVLLDCC